MIALDKIDVEVLAVLGERMMRLSDVLRLQRGALIELHRECEGHVNLSVGGVDVARGRLECGQGDCLTVVVASTARGTSDLRHSA